MMKGRGQYLEERDMSWVGAFLIAVFLLYVVLVWRHLKRGGAG